RTSATPLNMALFTAAIANGGVMPQAYMVTRVVGAFDNTIRQVSPRSFGRVMSSDMAEILAESMFEVVQNGTGTAARRQGLDIAGKTGTAQNETGIDHSWFIGFTQLEEATIALSIIIENTGGGPRATQLAGEIFEMLAEIE
ncbi:MAG: penicillin-binding transpeptidase domain-containing protein, partial [Defluviitaleaceae bacterium]|nr:penicillin-binding transpeptidase domain-containing protein [Defluviitaleaceae bacterium]